LGRVQESRGRGSRARLGQSDGFDFVVIGGTVGDIGEGESGDGGSSAAAGFIDGGFDVVGAADVGISDVICRREGKASGGGVEDFPQEFFFGVPIHGDFWIGEGDGSVGHGFF